MMTISSMPGSRPATGRRKELADRRRAAGGGQSRVARLGVHVLLVGFAIVTILPFVWLVRSSLMGGAQIFAVPTEWIPSPFQFDNFSEALTAAPFARYLLNTMIIELLVVSGTVITTSIAAFSFARLRWRGRDVVFAIILTSVMLPYAATLIPTFLMWDFLEGVNTFYPLTVPAWFGGAAGGALNLFLLRQFFLSIPRELDDAAYVDGASPPRVFVSIILPLSKPGIVVVTIFTSVTVWNDFLNPLVYLNDDSKFTLALGLASFQGLHSTQWQYLMAASAAVTAPMIVLFFVAQRYFIEGITLTGLKG